MCNQGGFFSSLFLRQLFWNNGGGKSGGGGGGGKVPGTFLFQGPFPPDKPPTRLPPFPPHTVCETIKHHPQVLDIFLRYTFSCSFWWRRGRPLFPSILTTPHFPIHSRPVCCLSFFFSAGTYVPINLNIFLCLSMFIKTMQ